MKADIKKARRVGRRRRLGPNAFPDLDDLLPTSEECCEHQGKPCSECGRPMHFLGRSAAGVILCLRCAEGDRALGKLRSQS